MNKTILLLSSILIFTSCAHFQAPKEKDTSAGYVTGEDLNKEFRSSEIEKNLTRTLSMAGGRYSIKFIPLTNPLITERNTEESAVKSLTKQQQSIVLKNKQKTFTKDKFCFEAEMAIFHNKKMANFKEWKMVVVDHKKDIYPITWKSSPKVVEEKIMRYHGPAPRYHLKNIGCTDAPINLASGIDLKATPSYMYWPHDKSQKVSWRFDKVVTLDGIKTTIRPVEKKVRYRNW